MAEPIYHIRGRRISRDDLRTIRGLIATHWKKGRSAISRQLCEQWNWYQDNGRLKDRACRVMLLKLEEKGEITLPPRKMESYRYRGSSSSPSKEYIYNTSPLSATVSRFHSLTFKLVSRTPDEDLWNHLVSRYHYLGNPGIVGSSLKYIAYLDNQIVACLGWGSAAWQVAARDHFIGWDQRSRKANLHRVVNNVRFLILPWIDVLHLASKLLAKNCRLLQKDWYAAYHQQISLLETFVDTSRYRGTCYRAANWMNVGETRGRGKYGQKATQPIKAVYLYPLSKKFWEELSA